MTMDERILARLAPARRDGGLRIAGKYVWCGTVMRAADRWHLFSSVWPEREAPERYDAVELLQNYWCLSTIVHAVADQPEGPYTPLEVVLEGRGGDHWIHECCHNPCLVRAGDTYVLYFQTKGRAHDDRYIGYATASSLNGPWTLADAPLSLGYNVNNPAVWVEPDGAVRIIYRTPGMKLAVAVAPAYDAPYQILTDDLLPGVSLEDPFLYRLGGRYHLLVEDNRAQLTGDLRHGAHLVSDDGVRFELFEPEPKAYTHTIAWTDGGVTTVTRRERPWLILDAEGPTHLVTGVLAGGEAWSVVQPLAGSH
jgi:hypothetical protein